MNSNIPNQKPIDKDCLLILSMHRSGTSALSRVLNIAGADLPKNVIGIDQGNELGHWESKEIVKYSDKILKEFNIEWDEWNSLKLENISTNKKEEIIEDIKNIVFHEYGNAKLIVIKDPRICLYGSLFIQALEDSGYNVHIASIIRNPLDVMNSLSSRKKYWPDYYSEIDGGLLWLRYCLEAEYASRNKNRIFITYDALLNDWRATLERIFDKFGLIMKYKVAEIRPQIEAFLSKKERHHFNTTEQVMLDDSLRNWIGKVYEALLRLTVDSMSEESMKELDSIKFKFNDASAILSKYVENQKKIYFSYKLREEAYNSSIKELEHNLELMINKEGAYNSSIKELEHNYESMIDKEKEYSKSISEKNTEVSKLNSRIYDLENKIQTYVNTNNELQRKNKKCMATISEMNTKHSDLLKSNKYSEVKVNKYIEIIDKLENNIKNLKNESHNKNKLIDEYKYALTAANSNAESILNDFNQSISWKITSPLRAVSNYFINKNGDGQYYPIEVDKSKSKKSPKSFVFFTICSRNFLAYAITLKNSLLRYYPDLRFCVALCDDSDLSECGDISGINFIYLDDLDLPTWPEMSKKYNITEFNTSIKPFVFKYLFENVESDYVVYLDPDIYVVNRMIELEDAFNAEYSMILTPHMLEPAINAEMNEKRLLQYGIYNLGFLAVKNSEHTKSVIEWWGERLLNDCVIKRDEGLFVDQKWADHFPAFIDSCYIIRHPGYNVAYWNLSSRKVTWDGLEWKVNDSRLRFYHFSGHDLKNKNILSRHSTEHTPKTIGHLGYLLNEYRNTIIANGHEKFSSIPYAFSWNGTSGKNEHTPNPIDGTSENNIDSLKNDLKQVKRKIDHAYRQGGLRNIAKQATRAGLRAYKHKKRSLNNTGENDLNDISFVLSWRRKILFVDWDTPKPDRDSGSRTAFYTLKLLTELGYNLTFLPCNLEYAEKYTENLNDLGIQCINYDVTNSIEQYLQTNGNKFDFIILNRGPVVWPFIDTVKNYCTNSKIIFNTVDLHYLRELREAKLSNSEKKIAAAYKTKDEEINIINSSDMTIVLSEFEKKKISEETDSTNVRILPLVFSNLYHNINDEFAKRKDILFIGSFPHLPNIDAVLYFAKEVFPLVKEKIPDCVWHIIGSQPPKEILKLNDIDGIIVHGYVEDLSTVFNKIKLTVAPLRYGAGIKGKIATSLSYGVPVIASSVAVEGMALENKREVIIADNPHEFSDSIFHLYNDEIDWNRMSKLSRTTLVKKYSEQANGILLGNLMKEIDETYKDIDYFEFSSKNEHDLFFDIFSERKQNREQIEFQLIPPGNKSFDTVGYCAVCGGERSFRTSFEYSNGNEVNGKLLPNWREHIACDECGLVNRLRAAYHIFLANHCSDINSSIYITENVTPLYKLFEKTFKNIVGSEYLGDSVPLGEVKDGVRNEDLTQLTFDDGKFDYVLSFDVLEHVSSDIQAFKEIHRVLKSNGILFFSAPFSFTREEKVIRTITNEDGSIKHLLTPEYHGNPVDHENGALCYRYFAWDVIKDLKSLGFEEVKIISVWSKSYMYLGKGCYFIVAKKIDKNSDLIH